MKKPLIKWTRRTPCTDHDDYLPETDADGSMWAAHALCLLCITSQKTSHPEHYFPGCDCAAAGFAFDHSSHCYLHRAVFHFLTHENEETNAPNEKVPASTE